MGRSAHSFTHFGALLTPLALAAAAAASAAAVSWNFSGKCAGSGCAPSSVSWRTRPDLWGWAGEGMWKLYTSRQRLLSHIFYDGKKKKTWFSPYVDFKFTVSVHLSLRVQKRTCLKNH